VPSVSTQTVSTPSTILADSRGKRIGILIVAYNAVTTLAHVLNRIPEAVWSNVEEVVVFDDASSDHTYELAVGYKALTRLDNLTVIKNVNNLGYGGNQKLGYQYFIDKGFDVVVLLHGDGQYAPEILADMYAPILNGEADAVFGSRMMPDHGGPRKGGMPLYKYVGNRILTTAENFALKMDLTEFHSGYRAYSLDALKQIDMESMTNDFHFDTEIIIKLHHQKLRIAEVPIPTYYGDEICYVNGMSYAKNVMRSLVRYDRTVNGITRYPEFAEYFPTYPLKNARYSSHSQILKLVGKQKDVLDVGCGHGYFSRELHKQGNRIVGIDIVPEPDERDVLERYIQADLNDRRLDLADLVGDRRFDVVLLPDVLEHLNEPERLLRACKAVLRPHGIVIISLPNVANITVRASLLMGRFDYTERGILDRTHLRFFTRKTARDLVKKSGYDIVEHRMTVMPVELVLGLNPERGPMRVLGGLMHGLTSLMPGLLGYQSLLVCRPRSV
jgi:2-polyprenyl-3-methyl-5-hydroxy-6-metoxy-1,4-benzoquinol methylase